MGSLTATWFKRVVFIGLILLTVTVFILFQYNTWKYQLRQYAYKLSTSTIFDSIVKKNMSNLITKNSAIAKNYDNTILRHITFDSVEIASGTYKLLILISSHTMHKGRRDVIRKLWGNRTRWRAKERWLLVFVVGKTTGDKTVSEIVRQEARAHKDMLIEDIKESFYSLAKKVIIGLTWAQHYVKFENVLKGDDDVFVNIDNALRFLRSNKKSDGYYGQLMRRQPVERRGRYKLTKDEHERDHFDPYCSGGGFIMTNSSVYKTMKRFNFNNVLRIDDAYIGETAYKAGVVAEGRRGFYMWNNACKYYAGVIVSHPANTVKCQDYLMNESSATENNNDGLSKSTEKRTENNLPGKSSEKPVGKSTKQTKGNEAKNTNKSLT